MVGNSKSPFHLNGLIPVYINSGIIKSNGEISISPHSTFDRKGEMALRSCVWGDDVVVPADT